MGYYSCFNVYNHSAYFEVIDILKRFILLLKIIFLVNIFIYVNVINIQITINIIIKLTQINYFFKVFNFEL